MNIESLIDQVSVAADTIAANIYLAKDDTDRGILVSVALWSLWETISTLAEDQEAGANLLAEFIEQARTIAELAPTLEDDGNITTSFDDEGGAA